MAGVLLPCLMRATTLWVEMPEGLGESRWYLPDEHLHAMGVCMYPEYVKGTSLPFPIVDPELSERAVKSLAGNGINVFMALNLLAYIFCQLEERVEPQLQRKGKVEYIKLKSKAKAAERQGPKASTAASKPKVAKQPKTPKSPKAKVKTARRPGRPSKQQALAGAPDPAPSKRKCSATGTATINKKPAGAGDGKPGPDPNMKPVGTQPSPGNSSQSPSSDDSCAD